MTESGYRLYGEAELEWLEHILALRFVGFNLEQIKELLHGPNRPLSVALRMQRDVIVGEKRRLDLALAAIDEAERALTQAGPADRWQTHARESMSAGGARPRRSSKRASAIGAS